jgi:hypothetical protein
MKKILMIFTLATFFAACSPVDYNTFGNITGMAIDFDTQEALSGVMITVSPGGYNTFTGIGGFFQFNDLDITTKQYQLQAQKEGYQTNRNHFTISPGETKNINITLKKEEVPPQQ